MKNKIDHTDSLKEKMQHFLKKIRQFNERNPELLTPKRIILALLVIVMTVMISYGSGRLSLATTISDYEKQMSQLESTNKERNLDYGFLETKYKSLNEKHDKYKTKMSFFEKLTKSEVAMVESEVQKRRDEENEQKRIAIDEAKKKEKEERAAEEKARIEKEEKRAAEEKARKEKEEKLAAEEEAKKEEARLAAKKAAEEEKLAAETETKNAILALEFEYQEARAEVEGIMNDAFSKVGTITFNQKTYTFILDITDQDLINSIYGVMNGLVPQSMWVDSVSNTMASLSETVSDRYGYGNFSFAISNPLNSEYQILQVSDGLILYDFIDDL